jgi:Tetracyclin repressor-like, C-terminal domain
MCTDAYREALTRGLSSTASSGPAPPRELFEYGRRRAAEVIEHAIERSELPAGTDPASVLSAMIAPIYFRPTVTAEPVDSSAAPAYSSRPPGRAPRLRGWLNRRTG